MIVGLERLIAAAPDSEGLRDIEKVSELPSKLNLNFYSYLIPTETSKALLTQRGTRNSGAPSYAR